MKKAKLEKILKNPENKIFVLNIREQPVGFAELEYLNKGEVEMHYFCLVPNARG